jgi:hypothetical protein
MEMAKDYEGDYEFEEAGLFDKAYRDISKQVAHPLINQVAAAFEKNIERVRAMCTFPIDMISWTAFTMRAQCRARLNVGLSLQTTDDTNPMFQAEFARIMQYQVAELHAKYVTGGPPPKEDQWGRGALFLKRTMQFKGEQPEIEQVIFDGVEAILLSMLLSSYAAFETAATDLWIALVDGDTRAAVNWAAVNPKKNFTMAELAGHDFNFTGKVGSYLYEGQKVSFNALVDIKIAYSSAFKGAADKCFGPENDLKEIEKIRHLLAHRGGLIDSKFKGEMEGYPDYANQNVGAYVAVSGPMVRRNINAVVNSAVALFKFGDVVLKT